MKIIGITGQVGSGKSELLRALEKEMDCHVIRADEVAAGLQEPGGECYDRVKEVLGPDCIGVDGGFDKSKVAARIFSDKAILDRINSIVHPAVRQSIEKEIGSRRAGGCPLLFLEAALLLEAGYRDICDEIWYVFVDDDLRQERLAASRGYSREKTESILHRQLSDAEFRKRCDRVIDNSGFMEHTLDQVREILNKQGGY